MTLVHQVVGYGDYMVKLSPPIGNVRDGDSGNFRQTDFTGDIISDSSDLRQVS